MKEHFNNQNAIDSILQKTKEQYNPGAMKPAIRRIVEMNGKTVSGLRLQWLHYEGMGDFGLGD